MLKVSILSHNDKKNNVPYANLCVCAIYNSECYYYMSELFDNWIVVSFDKSCKYNAFVARQMQKVVLNVENKT